MLMAYFIRNVQRLIMTKSIIHPELEIPEWGTDEYRIWWESQYDQYETHELQRTPPLSVLEWADGFVGK